MSLLELFCHVDDFWLAFAPAWCQLLLQTGKIKRQRSGQLVESEIMTILIHFHQSHYRDFKTYYLQHVCAHLRSEFPKLVSYSRFVDLIPSVLVPLSAYLEAVREASQPGVTLIASSLRNRTSDLHRKRDSQACREEVR